MILSKLTLVTAAAIILSTNSSYQAKEITPVKPLQQEIIEEVVLEPWYTDEEVNMLTNLLYGEAGGVKDKAQQAAVVWCVLNRVDAGYGTLTEVITAPNQFTGYKKSFKNLDQKSYARCKEIVIDVLNRYATEDQEGRTLPKEYLWYYGDGKVNYFRNSYKKPYIIWDWSLESPYK